MDWLMGKARGVSKGIMSSGSSNQTSGSSTTTDSYSTPIYAENQFASQQLPMNSINLSDLVEPFPYIDPNEWLAINTIGLFDNISTLYDAVYEMCTCTAMTGPGPITYVATDERGKKIKCSARQYMDSILAQSHDVIKSTKYFPTRNGVEFPSDFRSQVITVCRHLFQVLVHLYASHFADLNSLELVLYINTITKHFFLFNARFKLVDDKEIEVLSDLNASLLKFSPSSASQPPEDMSPDGDPVVSANNNNIGETGAGLNSIQA